MKILILFRGFEQMPKKEPPKTSLPPMRPGPFHPNPPTHHRTGSAAAARSPKLWRCRSCEVSGRGVGVGVTKHHRVVEGYYTVNPKNRSKPPSKNGLPFQRTRNPHLEYRFLAWSWVDRCRWYSNFTPAQLLAAKRDDQDIVFCTLSFMTVF